MMSIKNCNHLAPTKAKIKSKIKINQIINNSKFRSSHNIGINSIIFNINHEPLDAKTCFQQNNTMSINNPNTPTSQISLSTNNNKFKQVHKTRKIILVALFTWLLLNTDPIAARRTITGMIASRMISRAIGDNFGSRSLFRNLGTGSGGGGNNGLSTIEAIALIQAMNNNNNNHNNYRSQSTSFLSGQDTALSTRQLPVPVPVPVPPTPPLVAAFAAAAAAFLAAVAAGQPPIVAALVAFVAIIIALFPPFPPFPQLPQKNAPIVKKLVIKKTILPFVIPIPIKKNEKKVIIHNHKEKSHKHKEHHHEHESHDHYTYKKKSDPDPSEDVNSNNGNFDDTIEPELPDIDDRRYSSGSSNNDRQYGDENNVDVGTKRHSSNKNRIRKKNTTTNDGRLDHIESLLQEQEQLQRLSDAVVGSQDNNNNSELKKRSDPIIGPDNTSLLKIN